MSFPDPIGRTAIVFRHNLAILLADPLSIAIETLMPVVLMLFLKGTGAAVLRQQGFEGASGAEQVVPGMAVLFAFFGVGFLASAFFAEHHWGTWDRLRASSARPLEVLLGKMAPSALLILVQMATMFAFGVVLVGLQIRGSWWGVGVMMLASTAFLIAMSMLCVATLRTINQLMVVVNMGAIVLSGIGGGFTPVDALPGWAQAIAPVSPAYWMLEGFRAMVLEGGGVGATAVPAAVTLAFAAAAAAIAAWRFRFTDEKAWDE